LNILLIEITVHQSSISGICNSVGVYSHLEIIRQLTQFILDILRWTCNSYIHVKVRFIGIKTISAFL